MHVSVHVCGVSSREISRPQEQLLEGLILTVRFNSIWQIVLSHCRIDALYDGYGLRQRVGDERAAAVATDREFEMRQRRPWQQGEGPAATTYPAPGWWSWRVGGRYDVGLYMAHQVGNSRHIAN